MPLLPLPENALYDSVTYHPEALDYFYRLMGADHLLFGSDHPFGQPYSMEAEMVEQLDCTPAEKEMIYHGNAEGLLGISERCQDKASTDESVRIAGEPSLS